MQKFAPYKQISAFLLSNLIFFFYLCNNQTYQIMNSNLKSFCIFIIYMLGAIACFAFFQFCYPYHLYYQEQNQLFLASWDYLTTYLEKPGWLACMAGDFLTQFYLYRFMGATILTLCILLAGHNIKCAVRKADIKGTWLPNLAAFVVMTVLVCFSFDYDYRLSSILAIAGGASVFCVSTTILVSTRKLIYKIEKMDENNPTLHRMRLPHWISAFSIVISIFVCHWFFGYGVWIYGALVFTGCLVNIMKADTYYCLTALVITFFLLMLNKRLYFCDFQTIYTYPGIGKLVKPQLDQERTLAVDCEYYFGNYNRVINMVEKDKNPNQYMKFYHDLIMAQFRSQPASLKKYPNKDIGTFETLEANPSLLTIHALNELYWVLDDMTFCERAAMLGNIYSPNCRNIRMVKRLAEINLVRGNYAATRKYLRILQKTFVWKRWADRIFASLGKNASAEEKAILQTYLDKRKNIRLEQ